MLVAYPLSNKGYRYPIMRGSGLFIYLLGVWRCLLEDRQEIIPRFFRITTNRQIGNGGDIEQNKWVKNIFWFLVSSLALLCAFHTNAQEIISTDISDGRNGSFFVTNKYSNGNKSIIMYVPCSCRGTLHCTLCGGTGVLYGGWQCMICNGTGQCFCAKYDYPGYAIASFAIFDQFGNRLSHESIYENSPSSTQSNGHRNNTRNTSSNCYVCGGTGIDPQPCDTGTGNWIGYYNSKGTKCPYCGRYSHHRHNKCYHCNVPR